MSGFPTSDLNFLSFTLYHICSFPQGTLVLGWDFSVALKSCLDGLPASPRQLKAWLPITWDVTIWYMVHRASMGSSCFLRQGFTCGGQVSKAAHTFPALLGQRAEGNLCCWPSPQNPMPSQTTHLHGLSKALGTPPASPGPQPLLCSARPCRFSGAGKHDAKSAGLSSTQGQCPGLGGRWETWGGGEGGGPDNAVWWHAHGDPSSSQGMFTLVRQAELCPVVSWAPMQPDAKCS